MRTPSTLRLHSRLFLLVHVLVLALFPPLLHSTRIAAIATATCGDVVINEIRLFGISGGIGLVGRVSLPAVARQVGKPALRPLKTPLSQPSLRQRIDNVP